MPTTIMATVDPARGRVDARTEHGKPIEMAADPPHGDGTAAGPKETLLAALAACTAMDVAAILGKKRQVVASYEVAVRADSADEHPKVFTAITVEHRLGGDLDSEAVRRSVELSSTRYCPISAMLSRAVPIEHWYRLSRPDGDEVEVLVAVTGPSGHRVL
jgi:putative redox protein